MNSIHRRQFIKRLGLSAASLPFLMGLPSLGLASPARPRQRLIVMFSPNGTIPPAFWPDEVGADFKLKEIMTPLEAFKDRMLVLNGLCNKVRGDGDNHMRGMSCLLTGIELFPGNIQGGSHTPAGWASGISIDQELKNFFQSKEETRTRFGSIEFGVGVTDRADPWTRMSYAGPNQPIGPISDPYQMYQKLYGQMKDKENLQSILTEVRGLSSNPRAPPSVCSASSPYPSSARRVSDTSDRDRRSGRWVDWGRHKTCASRDRRGR